MDRWFLNYFMPRYYRLTNSPVGVLDWAGLVGLYAARSPGRYSRRWRNADRPEARRHLARRRFGDTKRVPENVFRFRYRSDHIPGSPGTSALVTVAGKASTPTSPPRHCLHSESLRGFSATRFLLPLCLFLCRSLALRPSLSLRSGKRLHCPPELGIPDKVNKERSTQKRD